MKTKMRGFKNEKTIIIEVSLFSLLGVTVASGLAFSTIKSNAQVPTGEIPSDQIEQKSETSEGDTLTFSDDYLKANSSESNGMPIINEEGTSS